LGVFACNTNELPAATSATFAQPENTSEPSEIAPIATSTKVIKPTDTAFPTSQIPTNTPTPIPTTLPLCFEEEGTIEENQLETEWLDEPLNYIVYLPPCYDEMEGQYLPSLYLFHGQTYSNYHWIDLGVMDVVDQLILNRQIVPFIMVFPLDPDHITPPPENAFGEAVFFDLIPTIDRNYRTVPEREYRAIGGISRGGNWAIHIGLPHPGFFGAIGAHSTPVFSTDTNRDILEWLTAIPFEELPRIFVDTGENDRWFRYTMVLEELLDAEGIPHEFYLYPGFHEDKYWQSHLEQYILWYAEPWSKTVE
jgi:enterochelin esterase-like enzyme